MSDEITCLSDADCSNFDICDTLTSACRHKSLFPPKPLEVMGWFVLSLAIALCNIGGIGGGLMSVPILIAFFHFETKKAVAISSFAIFFSVLASFIINFKKRHPEKPSVV